MGEILRQIKRDWTETAAMEKKRALRAPLAAKSAREYKQSELGEMIEKLGEAGRHEFVRDHQYHTQKPPCPS